MGFITYKQMNAAKIPEFLLLKCLEDSGILKIGYELLVAFESVYSEFLDLERKEAERRAEMDRIKSSLR